SYREELAALVAEGIARGEFRETDPDTVAVSIIALLEGMSVLWVLDRDRVPISRIGPTSFDLLMNGLRPVGPPSTKETP
ncbi:MAG: TetR family transcriptional regulator C-terminal domain-containing protein, partial [Chloroflexota bacterium]